MPYVLLIFGKITTNKHTVQDAKTRIFISKFRSFFAKIYVFFYVFSEKSQPWQPLGCCDMVMIVEI